MNPQHFGADLKQLRESNRVWQRDLARELGVPVSRIEGIEEGTCSLTRSQLTKYLKRCGVGQESDICDYWNKMLDVRDHVEWVLYEYVSKEIADKTMDIFWRLEEEGEMVAAEADSGVG
jgi:transcriptional regulator with XRE-family HTH domain